MAQVSSGVPQGSVLGPLLFLIFINDLPNGISSQIRLFADDCVVYRAIKSDQDHRSLQSDLESINSWCSSWLMKLNHSKTKLVSFTRNSSRLPTTYTLNHTPVDSATSYKYLGLHLQSDLSWNYHIDHILASANRSLGMLKRNLRHAPAHVRKLAYITLIRPKIEYASAIWDPQQAYIIDNIESLQNRAARFIFSDYSRFTSVTALKARAGLHNLSHRRKLARLSLFHRIYHHPLLHDDFFQSPLAIFPRRDHPLKIKRITCHTSSFANSFIPKTIIEWNQLPRNVAVESNISKFNDLLINDNKV